MDAIEAAKKDDRIKLMVLDLEERTEDLECFWRTAAVHTFLESLSKGE